MIINLRCPVCSELTHAFPLNTSRFALPEYILVTYFCAKSLPSMRANIYHINCLAVADMSTFHFSWIEPEIKIIFLRSEINNDIFLFNGLFPRLVASHQQLEKRRYHSTFTNTSWQIQHEQFLIEWQNIFINLVSREDFYHIQSMTIPTILDLRFLSQNIFAITFPDADSDLDLKKPWRGLLEGTL